MTTPTSPQERPTTSAQVIDLLQSAAAANAPVELLGHGSKRAWGRPIQANTRISLAGLAGVEHYEPAELVLTAAAGTRLVDIEAELASHAQHLAFEPPDLGPLLGADPGLQTLGGAVACNLSGPRRLQAGAARDFLLGVHGVTGRGEAFKAGGRVVKNVTGYDIPRLMAGAFGTLAALTQVSLKILPRPAASATLVVTGITAAEAVALFIRALGSPLEVSGAAWLPDSLAATLGFGLTAPSALLRLEGHATGLHARLATLQHLVGGAFATQVLDADATALCWRQIRDVQPLATPADTAVWRVQLRPTDAVALLAEFPDAPVILDWGGGLLWFALPTAGDGGALRLRSRLATLQGQATLVRAPLALRTQVDVFTVPPPALQALTRRVKQAFDPLALLNRGRLHADL